MFVNSTIVIDARGLRELEKFARNLDRTARRIDGKTITVKIVAEAPSSFSVMPRIPSLKQIVAEHSRKLIAAHHRSLGIEVHEDPSQEEETVMERFEAQIAQMMGGPKHKGFTLRQQAAMEFGKKFRLARNGRELEAFVRSLGVV